MANSTGKMKVSEKAQKAIENMIFTEMHSGDRLPTEEKLVERFGVSRTSIREALRALEAAKIVEKRNGGTFVTEQPDECFVEPLCIMLQLAAIKKEDIIDIRELLEINAAGKAALHALPEDIAELEKIVWLMQKPDITLEEYIQLDVCFHHLIGKATGNAVLYQLIKDIGAVLTRLYSRYCTLEIIHEQAIPQQKQILAAIKSRDPEEAKKWMGEHIRHCDEIFKD